MCRVCLRENELTPKQVAILGWSYAKVVLIHTFKGIPPPAVNDVFTFLEDRCRAMNFTIEQVAL